MRLWVIRHAKAEQGFAGPDAARALTPRGIRQAAFLASELATQADPPTLLVASPAVRTVQTATPIAEALGVECTTDDRLACDRGSNLAFDAIAAQDAPVFAVVGHNPTLEVIIAFLTQGVAGAGVRVRTGEAFLLESSDDQALEPGAASLVHRLRLDD